MQGTGASRARARLENSSRRRWVAGLVALEALLLAVSLPNFTAKFGIVDDHVIVDVLRSRPRLPLTELVGELTSRFPEGNGRFRPLFMVDFLVEASWAGQNPVLWYADRFVLVGVTAAVAYYIAARFVAPWAAVIAVMVTLMGLQFEPWARLAAAEAYAMPAFLGGVAVIVGVRCAGRRLWKAWPGFVLLAVASLTKENFLLAFLVAIPTAAVAFGICQLTRRDWATLGAAAALAVGNGAMIAWFIRREGVQYIAERSVSAFVDWGAFALVHFALEGGLLVAVPLALMAWSRTSSTRRRWLLAGAAAVAVFTLAQVAFYTGNAQTGRYLNPAAIICGVACIALCSRIGALRWPPLRTVAAAAAVIAVGAGSLTSVGFATSNMRRTNTFQAQLGRAVETIQASGVTHVVLQPHDALNDQERALSLARYLTNATGVRVSTLPAAFVSDEFSAYLSVELAEWSTRGHPGALEPFVPGRECLSLIFGEAAPVCSRSLAAPAEM